MWENSVNRKCKTIKRNNKLQKSNKVSYLLVTADEWWPMYRCFSWPCMSVSCNHQDGESSNRTVWIRVVIVHMYVMYTFQCWKAKLLNGS